MEHANIRSAEYHAEVAQALAVLSDGAFKLYIHLSISAYRLAGILLERESN